MKRPEDSSWVIVLLILSMIALFFVPVIFDSDLSRRSSTLQWISAIGGITGPLSAIFVSFHVFIDQNNRDKRAHKVAIKNILHEEIKTIYDMIQFSFHLDNVYGGHYHRQQTEVDDNVMDRSSSISIRIDSIPIWSNDDKLLLKRMSLVSRLKNIKLSVSRRVATKDDDFISYTLESLDEVLVKLSKELVSEITAYIELVDECAEGEGLTDFMRSFKKKTTRPPSSEPTPPPPQTSQP